MYSRRWSRVDAEGGVGRPGFVAAWADWDEHQIAAAEEIKAGLDRIDLVRLAFCDPHGLARSKTLTADAFRSVLANGMDFSPGPFIFDTGHAVAVDFLDDPAIGVDEIIGAGDFVVIPDPRTFQVLPGTEPVTAWVLGDEFLRDGSRHPLSARNVLRRVCARYAEHGLSPVVGLELEWYLTRRLAGVPGNAGNGFGRQGPAPRVEAMNAGYQFNLDSCYDSVAAVTDPLARVFVELGLPVRTMEHESGPGQVETTFAPLLAPDAADAMLLFRTLVKQICTRRGYHASFMSLPAIDGFDPSGWHLHQSVIESATGRNLFATDTEDDISARGRGYVAGLLTHARDLCLLSVPTVNGYRRLRPEFTLSPTRINWSFEHRGAMVRAATGSSAHLENRIGEPSANPYLAMAAQLSAGLEGMLDSESREHAGATGDSTWNGHDEATTQQHLPTSLAEALTDFRDGPADELLGKSLAACLAKLKQSEVSRYQAWCADNHQPGADVTEWEQREYFENY